VEPAGGDFMNNLPDWLPDIISVDGSFDDVLSRLYNVFHRDFIERHPKLNDMEVWHDKRVKAGEIYEESFWHLIERDHNKQGKRSFDPRRAERLPWCAPLLNNSDQPQVKYWICRENNRLICYVWLEDYDYVVILERRTLPPKEIKGTQKPARNIAYLKTAYHIDGESRRRYFRRKYEERIR
jgi:hypothetical protein